MMKKIMFFGVAIIMLIATISGGLAIQDNSLMAGMRITDSSNIGVNDANITVSFYNDAGKVSTAYSETFENSTDTNGYFTGGNIIESADVNITYGNTYYLDFEVDGSNYNFTDGDVLPFKAWFGQKINVDEVNATTYYGSNLYQNGNAVIDTSTGYLKTEIDTQGEVETIWGVTLATDTELAGQDECSEITGCVTDAFDNLNDFTGTLTDTKYCTYDATGGEIDCNSDAGSDTTCATSGTCSQLYTDEYIYHAGDADTNIRFNDDLDKIWFTAGNKIMLSLEEAGSDQIVMNPFVNDIDTYIYGDNYYVLKLDAGNNDLIINEQGTGLVNFRIEGDTDTNLFYTDAGNDRVGIGTATPSEKLEVVGNITSNETISAVSFIGDGSALTGISGSSTAARIYVASDQNVLSASSTKVNFDTVDFDTDTAFDTVNDYYVAPSDGYYLITTKLYVTSWTVERMITELKVNGTTVRQYWDDDLSNGNTIMSELVYLGQNDYVEIYVDSESDTNYYLGAGTGTYKSELMIIKV